MYATGIEHFIVDISIISRYNVQTLFNRIPVRSLVCVVPLKFN
jgi:hypothetical protein